MELCDITVFHYSRVDIVLYTNKFSYAWWYPPSIHDFIPLIAAGDNISDKEISKRGYINVKIKLFLATQCPPLVQRTPLERGNKRGWFLILVSRIIGKCLVLTSIYNFFPLIAAGLSPFSVAKKDHAEAVRRDHELL